MQVLLIIFTFLLLGCQLGVFVGALPKEKWHKLNDGEIIYMEWEMKYNWHMAWNECAMRNMSLIVIDDGKKSQALTELLKEVLGKSYNLWIGGNDLGEEGTFVWAQTGKRFEFVNWYKTQPDNGGGVENCAHIWEKTDYEWNDTKCEYKLGFICEQNQIMLAQQRQWEMKKEVIDRLFEL